MAFPRQWAVFVISSCACSNLFPPPTHTHILYDSPHLAIMPGGIPQPQQICHSESTVQEQYLQKMKALHSSFPDADVWIIVFTLNYKLTAVNGTGGHSSSL